MRTMAVDYGRKRIGIAISDAGGKWATPLEVLAADGSAVLSIAAIVAKEAVQRLIIGLPYNMDDTEGPMAKEVRLFAGTIASKVSAEVAIEFADERLSSYEAEQQLKSRKQAGEGLTRKRKKEQLDAVAAAVLLQKVLDGEIRGVPLLRAVK